MKKLFIIAAAACVTLASCVKNEPVQTPEFGESIAFEDPIMTPSVKAGVSEKTAFVASDDFKVMAWWTAGSTFTTPTSYVDEAFVVTRGASAWSYTGTYYWPKSGYLHFSAFSPASVGGALDAGGVTFTNYSVDTDITKQIDLLFSDRKTTSYEQPVQMVFNHALSAINFTVTKGSAAPDFVLTGISIADINSVGDFDQNLDVDEGEPTWTTETPTAYAVSIDSPITLSNAALYAHTGTNAASGGAALMLLPQSVAGKVVTLTYTMDEIPQTSTFTLAGSWDPGYRYTYAISFSVEGIEFTASIDPWVDGEATGTLN